MNAGPVGSTGNAVNYDVQFDYGDPHVAQSVNLQLSRLILLHNVSEKTNLTFRVLDPPTLTRMPEGTDRARFACFGLLTGFLAGVLIAGLFRLRTASSTRDSR
jgi:LPS O-antigen subunit length determinant protein (WzzB/FepE family)